MLNLVYRFLMMLFVLLSVCMVMTMSPALSADFPEIKLTFVKGGCFSMGDQYADGGADERPLHEVCVDDFYLGTFKITEAQWQAVMAGNISPRFKSRGSDFPVSGVSWYDVSEFLRNLDRQSGLNYRLPTEAEWEYSARSGGKNHKFAGTNDVKLLADYACYEASCGGEMQPVGRRRPTELGLYDMGGDVWEWVQDRYDAYYYRQSPRQNPPGDPFGVNRVLRGGSCSSASGQLRTSYRDYVAPDVRRDGIGFRVLLPAK